MVTALADGDGPGGWHWDRRPDGGVGRRTPSHVCSCPATSPSGAAGAATAPAAVGVGGRRSSEQPEAQNRSRQRNADLGYELHALHLFSLDPWGGWPSKSPP